MREYYSIPSREEADRFSEAYLDAQREYNEHLDEMYENGYEAGKKDAMAAWNGFRLKGNTDVPWEGGWENWLN